MAERFGDFELLTLLSVDAALDSYLAVPLGGGAKLVLRRLRRTMAAQPGARDTFLQDAHAAMQLSHPNLSRVVALGEVEHQPYLAHEHIDGQDLGRVMQRARAAPEWPLSPARALGLFLPVLDALSAAHQRTPPTLHRDLSPRNVFLTPDGRVVLTDFALARTRRSAGLGMKDVYVSPEQAQGRPLNAASDVFAAGLVLFELVCGRLPAEGEKGEVIARIGSGELDAALTVNPTLGPLAGPLAKALAVRREDRFCDAAAFAAALRALGLAEEDAAARAAWWASLPEAPASPPASPAQGEAPEPARQPQVAPPTAAHPAALAPEQAPKRRLTTRFLLGILGGLVASQLALWWGGAGLLLRPGVDDARQAGQLPAPEVFQTTVVTFPNVADAQLDGAAAGKTPLKFTAERDRVYRVSLSGAAGTMELAVQNDQLVEVDLGERRVKREVRIAGTRPQRAAVPQPAPKAGPPATPAATGTPSFTAQAPARFTLGRLHQVRVDDGPQLPRGGATLREVSAGWRNAGTGYAPPAVRTARDALGPGANQPLVPIWHLSLLLSRFPDRVVLRPATGELAVPDAPSWAFALSERTAKAMDTAPQFTLTGQQRVGAVASVVVLEGDNRFTVTGLDARQDWKLTLKPVERAGTLPCSPVLRLFGSGVDGSALFDAEPQPTSTVVLEPSSSHVVSGVYKLWLAVPVVSGVEASPLEVTVEAL